ncbi:MAG: succinylglutamate desuccinylase/aspartoacylase family protein [Halobacteriovoraceae bacterium]|nr:succinylglutamate desuccinylase/aspartoacylase family protein [Halobacteriovoraceae bacterium]MCB9093861.1 succinylglutamate desuccinylase/aspartoacylase family protein [Halobacteriovoraceae bacterium]
MKKKSIPVRQMASGDSLEIPVFEFEGSGEAPSVYIQANIHGAEVQGNLVCYFLLDYLAKNPPLGNITIVPKANPYGLNAKLGEYTFGRFDPTNGKNYNRNYFNLVAQNLLDGQENPQQINLSEFIKNNNDCTQSTIVSRFQDELNRCLDEIGKNQKKFGADYGDFVCFQLQKMAQKADIVLDLHTASNSLNHLYAPDISIANMNANYLGIENIITIQNEFLGALDEACFIPWYGLQKAFRKHSQLEISIPVEAYTVELGSQERADEAMAFEQFENIINYLKFRGSIKGEVKKPSLKYNICRPDGYKRLFAPYGGIVSYKVKPGQDIKKGDVIAHVFQFDFVDNPKNISEAKKEILSPFNGRVINLTDSSIIHEHMEFARVMIKE